MASVSFTQFSLVPRICRWNVNVNPFPYINFVKIQDSRVNEKVLKVVSKAKKTDSLSQEASDGEAEPVEKKTPRTSKRASPKTRKKAVKRPDENSAVEGNASDEERLTISASTENPRKNQTRTRKKAPSTSATLKEEATEKVTRRRRTKKKADATDSEAESGDLEEDAFSPTMDEESDQELELNIDKGEDISSTYDWPPLVCCFGAAQNFFLPAGRRANRLIDYEIQDGMNGGMWEPENFVRAPGGTSSNVAIALASLGGRVAFMGKFGDDDWGRYLLYCLNMNNVQTRSVRIDSKRATSLSHMKIGKRGGLRMTAAKPCSEDCLSKSEIDIDVLKEAEMFYFNTFSLLDKNMGSTTLQAIKIAKKLGNVIFYDLNLPLPLWQSSVETRAFIERVWNLSDIIEVTKQELEFLCGITPSEKFDTRDNDEAKFVHYSPEVVSQLWHDDLKVLFVTNGTSKIHYYTKEHTGAVDGTEDVPLTPYTCDMSASGDGIVAGIMNMLIVEPHLICDKGYLENTIKYAINCGVIDQWKRAQLLGFPAKEGMDVEPDSCGIRSVTEEEYMNFVPSDLDPDSNGTGTTTEREYKALEPSDLDPDSYGIGSTAEREYESLKPSSA